MADPVSAGSFDLVSAFKKANHFFHTWIMTPSMLLMGASIAVAADPTGATLFGALKSTLSHTFGAFSSDGFEALATAAANTFGNVDTISSAASTAADAAAHIGHHHM